MVCGMEGGRGGESGSFCRGPEEERMRIQTEARGWKEEERGEKKTGGRTVKTCHRKWKVRDRED